MKRWLGFAIRSVVVLIAVLGMATATATPLAGQQAPDSVPAAGPDSVPQADTSAAPISSASTDLRGPRIRPDFQRVEPPFGTSKASSSAAAGSHTFTITTLVLVLAIIIIVLLVAN